MVKPQGEDQHQERRLTMGSSNKHWTDRFKSKSYSGSKSATFPSVLADGLEERTPEPKVRWNPRPEQICILEDIFNSGMVNPPKEEISNIRAQLQEYGQTVDSNVFYWFQNKRTRSKQKNRQQNSTTRSATSRQPMLPPSSSSSSSDRSSSDCVRSGGFLDLSKNSPGGLVNQNYFIPDDKNNQYLNLQLPNQVQMQAPPPNYYLTQQTGAVTTGVFRGSQTPGICFNKIMGSSTGASGSSQMMSFSRMLLGEPMIAGNSCSAVLTGPTRPVFEDEGQQMLNFMNTNPIAANQNINVPPPHAANFLTPLASQVQGVGGAGMVAPPKSTVNVLMNGVELEVSGVEPFYVQEAFGEDAVLFYQSGHPVPTNNRGVTLNPLKHGASYFLKRFPPAAPPDQFPIN